MSKAAKHERDSVLTELHQVEQAYLEARSRYTEQCERLQHQVVESTQTIENLRRNLEDTQRQLEQERVQSARQRERANQLTGCMKQINRSMFGGNIYEMILHACLTLTGGTRGLYLTARGKNNALRIRAAVGVDSYPNRPPSAFITVLCHKVLESRDAFVCQREDLSLLPPPELGEQFEDFLVTPVILLKNFDGIVIVADKMNGQFDIDDVDLLMSVGDQAAVAVENVHLQRELQKMYDATISMLADAMEAKDPYTRGHCDLVSHYAMQVATLMNLNEREKNIVRYAALLHDVGKIAVSDGILNKPGQLLPEERELVRSHVRIGHDLIEHVPALHDVAKTVLRHHEWYDGNGYPDGLRGEEIPVASRIVAVVDAYCAMITKRSYKDTYTDMQARSELLRCAGTQFDPQIVETFIAILETERQQGAADVHDEQDVHLMPGFERLQEFEAEVD